MAAVTIDSFFAQLRAFVARFIPAPQRVLAPRWGPGSGGTPLPVRRTAIPLARSDRFMLPALSGGELPEDAPTAVLLPDPVALGPLPVLDSPPIVRTAPVPPPVPLPAPTPYIPDEPPPPPPNPDRAILDAVGASSAVYVGPPEVAKAPSQLTATDIAQLRVWLHGSPVGPSPVGFAGYRWMPA